MQHRKEIIALTSEELYPSLKALIEKLGDSIGEMSRTWNDAFPVLWFNSLHWVATMHMGTTITDVDFLAKYAQNTPEDKPKWVFETDQELKDFVADFLASKSETFDSFLASKRFSLTCIDGVVTDPEQVVYHVLSGTLSEYIAKNFKSWAQGEVYLSKSAAETALKNGTRFIALEDMEPDGHHGLWISIAKADQLFNERRNEN